MKWEKDNTRVMSSVSKLCRMVGVGGRVVETGNPRFRVLVDGRVVDCVLSVLRC